MEIKDSIKEIIAEIEKGGDVKAVFGDPVRDGMTTVIPVASFNVSGGGGGGMQDGQEGDMPEGKMKGRGFGLGFRKKANPVGYIQIAGDKVKFVPIMDWHKFIPLAIPVIGLGAMMMMKMMMMKKCKKHEGNL